MEYIWDILVRKMKVGEIFTNRNKKRGGKKVPICRVADPDPDQDPVGSGMFCPDPDPELSFRIRIRPI